jgi:signal transduction histidine kinase
LLEDYAQSSVPIVGNANLLQQVIMNLVLNAFQAMPDGGDVRLCVRLEKDDAYVSVQDAGVGILAANMGRIFDPFFTTRPAGQGTGLGLSICHTIVKQHLGSIAVVSNADNVGTTFVVRLPLSLLP